jgi:putative transcriptional regulator
VYANGVPFADPRHASVVSTMSAESFEDLLAVVRRLREQRRRRIARLVGLGAQRPAADATLDVREIRAITGLSQVKFAELLSIEVATLRNWEQGRREPTGPARALLRAIRKDPMAVIRALSD